MKPISTTHLYAILMTLICAACSGGSRNVDAPVSDQPEVSILFPPPHTRTVADEIVVRGSASHSELISRVTVAGVLASTMDEYSNWYAVVPLGVGEAQLDVKIETHSGESIEGAGSVTVRREAVVPAEPVDMAFSAQGLLGPRAWYLESDRILSQDLFTSEVEVVSGPDRGNGPAIHKPLALAVDPDGLFAYVLHSTPEGQHQVLAVKAFSGNRIILASLEDGEGEPLETASDLLHVRYKEDEQVINLLAVSDHERKGLIAIDPLDGEIQFVERFGEVTQGADALALSRVANEESNPYLAVREGADVYLASLFKDLSELVATPGDGRGPIWSEPSGMTMISGGHVVVADGGSNEVFVIENLAPDYPRRRIAIKSDPSDLALQSITVLATGELDGTELVVALDTGLDMAVALDLESGKLSPFLESRFGFGPSMSLPVNLARAADGFLVSTAFPEDLIDVSLDTSGRRSVTPWGESTGTNRIPGLCFDEASDTAFVFDNFTGCLLAVDRKTGAQTQISGPDLGQGIDLQHDFSIDLAHDEGSQSVFALTGNHLVEVFLATGDRVVVSGGDVGFGEPISYAWSVVLDTENGRAFLIVFDRVVEVDLETGNRTVVSSSVVGQGPEFEYLIGGGLSDEATELIVITELAEILRVDIASGDRKLLTRKGDLGSAPRYPIRLHWDEEAEVAYTLSRALGSLVAFDPEGGQWVTVTR